MREPNLIEAEYYAVVRCWRQAFDELNGIAPEVYDLHHIPTRAEIDKYGKSLEEERRLYSKLEELIREWRDAKVWLEK